MRVLCEAPQSPARGSPAVGVADGFPYPWGWREEQRRSVQLIAFAPTRPGGSEGPFFGQVGGELFV